MFKAAPFLCDATSRRWQFLNFHPSYPYPVILPFRFILRACIHDVSITSSNKVRLDIPVLPSATEQYGTSTPVGRTVLNSPAPPGGDENISTTEPEEEEPDEDQQAMSGEEGAGGGLENSSTGEGRDVKPEVSSEGRTTWKGQTLEALRTPLFVVEIAVVGERGDKTFAYTQRLPAVKESALSLIDKAICSTQVMDRAGRVCERLGRRGVTIFGSVCR